MEPDSSLPCWKQPKPGLYPEPHKTSPYYHSTCLRSILILFFHLRLCLPNILFPSIFLSKLKRCKHSSFHTFYIPCSSHPPWLDHSNYICRGCSEFLGVSVQEITLYIAKREIFGNDSVTHRYGWTDWSGWMLCYSAVCVCRTVRWLMNSELEWVWKEAVVAEPWYCTSWGWLVSGPSLKPSTARICVELYRCVNRLDGRLKDVQGGCLIGNGRMGGWIRGNICAGGCIMGWIRRLMIK
jgi:hypothetical protein